MKVSELIERLGRTVFEAPFGAWSETISDSPEVAEIRIAVLDEVAKKIQRAGGKALFPYNVIRIVIRTGSNDASVFERDFFRRFFEEEVRKSLSKETCRFPADLRVQIRAVTDDDGEGNWLQVQTIAEDAPPAAEATPRTRRGARLMVESGAANKAELPLQKTRTNIGRLVDVYKAEGLSRRNKSDSNCGLWIIRDGMGQEVHRDTRGTRLLPGDEIHFGKAVVRFQVK